MRKYISVFLFCAAVILGTATGSAQENKSFIPASDPHIVYTGRVSFAHPESPKFVYPGVQIQAIFEGTSVGIHMKPNSGYFMVEIDNQTPFKIFISKNDSILTLKEGLSKGKHNIKIMLAYEAYGNKPEFRGFILDEGKTLPATPKLPNRKIEFIGNSITCGYGVESPNEKARFSNETENHYYTYAAMTARAFDAQSMVVARSGIGIYRNYNGPKTGNRNNMPSIYANTNFSDTSETWDFSRYTPDVVCINLGTNDFSTTPYDTLLYANGYRDFLKVLRGYYPKAKIVVMSGCMLSGKNLEDAKASMDRVVADARKAGDQEIYRFDLTPADGSLGYGADFHPSIAQNKFSAGEFIPFLEKLTGWKVIKDKMP